MPTLFTKIIQGDIPSTKIHEDDLCISILDIAPVNKGHLLVISKTEYETILDCPDEVLSHLISQAKQHGQMVVDRLGCDGFNIMINNGAASGQEVPHLHIHVIPRFAGDGKTPKMHKEHYLDGEMASFGKILADKEG